MRIRTNGGTLGMDSLNYSEVRARHIPLYYEVSSLTMEEGDVRGA